MLAAIESLEQRPCGLVLTIDVIDVVSPPLTPAQARQALLELNRAELIELRPESGVGEMAAPRELELVPYATFRGERIPLTFLRRRR